MKNVNKASYQPAGGLSNSVLQLLLDHYNISEERLIKEDLMSYVINERNYIKIASTLLLCKPKTFQSELHKSNYVIEALKNRL